MLQQETIFLFFFSAGVQLCSPYMVKCQTALTQALQERKIQRERNNWADTEDHSRPEKTDESEESERCE